MPVHRPVERTKLQPSHCRLLISAAERAVRSRSLRVDANQARLHVHLRAGLAQRQRHSSLHRGRRRVQRDATSLLGRSESRLHQHARVVCVRALSERLLRQRIFLRGLERMRSQQRRLQRFADGRMHQHASTNHLEFPNQLLSILKHLPRALRDAAIARSATKATEKHARQAPYAQLTNVLIAVSATKTPNVFNIPAARRNVSAELASPVTASAPADALRACSTLASRFAVETAEFARTTGRCRSAIARPARYLRCAIEPAIPADPARA